MFEYNRKKDFNNVLDDQQKPEYYGQAKIFRVPVSHAQSKSKDFGSGTLIEKNDPHFGYEHEGYDAPPFA